MKNTTESKREIGAKSIIINIKLDKKKGYTVKYENLYGIICEILFN